MGLKFLVFSLYLVTATVRFSFSRHYRKSEFAVGAPDRQRWMVWLVALATLPLTFAWTFTPWFDFAALNFPAISYFLGFWIFVCGIALLWWTHYTLGEFFSPVVELKDDHKLLKEGPYQWVRHPMYTSVFLVVLGTFFLSGNWLYGLIQFSVVALLIFVRIPSEEAVMSQKFGQQYREYAATTKKILPLIY